MPSEYQATSIPSWYIQARLAHLELSWGRMSSFLHIFLFYWVSGWIMSWTGAFMHKKMIKILRIYHISNLGNSLLEPNISAYKQNSFCLHAQVRFTSRCQIIPSCWPESDLLTTVLQLSLMPITMFLTIVLVTTCSCCLHLHHVYIVSLLL